MDQRTIHLGQHLISGEIANSEKGSATGHLILAGIAEPIEFNLQGDARSDLAGCIVKFHRRDQSSRPIDPEAAELLTSPQLGVAGHISAAGRGEVRKNDDPQTSLGQILRIEWLNFSILFRFVVEAEDCEFEIDLPKWSLSEDEIALQQKEFDSAKELFQELYEEFEEDLLDQEVSEDQFKKIDAILHKLEVAETDEAKLKLMREVLGPDVSEYELEGLLEAYFPEDPISGFDLEPDIDKLIHTAVVDGKLKEVSATLNQSVKLFSHLVDTGEAPDCVKEFEESLQDLVFRLVIGSPLDQSPEGLIINPVSLLRRVEEEQKCCESVIAYLELQGTTREKEFRDKIWELRKIVEDIIPPLKEKIAGLPPRDKDADDTDIPF